MYAIMNVVYGVAWEGGRRATSILDEACEEEIDGFNMPYNGGDGYGYFGVDVGEFDECGITKVKDLQSAPTPANIAQYKVWYDALDPSLRAAIDKLGSPTMLIVPSTS